MRIWECRLHIASHEGSYGCRWLLMRCATSRSTVTTPKHERCYYRARETCCLGTHTLLSRSLLISDVSDLFEQSILNRLNSIVQQFCSHVYFECHPTPAWDFSRLGTRGRKTRTCWDPWRHGLWEYSPNSVCLCLRFRPSYSALYGQLPVQSVRNTEYLQINDNLHSISSTS